MKPPVFINNLSLKTDTNYSVNTNNSFIPQQPHTGGYWSAGSGPWFSDAFYCQGTLIATYGGTTFTYNYSYNP